MNSEPTPTNIYVAIYIKPLMTSQIIATSVGRMYEKVRVILIFQYMMTSSNGNIIRVTGHLFGEFTGHWWIALTKPAMRSFDVFIDLRPNKRLGKQSWGW